MADGEWGVGGGGGGGGTGGGGGEVKVGLNREVLIGRLEEATSSSVKLRSLSF